MSTSVFPDQQTGSVRTSADQFISIGTTATTLARRTSALHRDVRDMAADTEALRRESALNLLGERAQEALRSGGAALLTDLRQRGFSWRDVARIVGISVPALQKWRRGEGISTGNLLRLAELVALTRILDQEHLIADPVSWLDTPVRPGVHLSKTDMLAAQRFDLVLELADDQTGPILDVLLDSYDAAWRVKYVDEAFEVFIAADGTPSIRARR